MKVQGGSVRRVNLVEDDLGVRESVGFLLALRGFDVRPFASAEEFLGQSDSELFGCLITDVRMPGMGGLELQRTLARRGVYLPTIVMTSHPGVAVARTAFVSGAIDFISKPVSEVELLDALARAFGPSTETLRNPIS